MAPATGEGGLTMAEYIDREAALALIRPDDPYDERWGVTVATAKELIRHALTAAPAADVAPVVHGQWLRSDDDWYSLTSIRCSICGEEWCFEMIDDVTLLNYKYCPNCGADMRGSNDE